MNLNLKETEIGCLKRCSVCEVRVQPFDVVIEYIHSHFRGSTNIRYAHLECWLSRQEENIVKRFVKKKVIERLAYKRLVLEV